MRRSRLVFAALFVTCTAAAASAQPASQMSPLEVLAGCAPPLAIDASHPLRVIGTQDPNPRELLDNHSLLVISGGTAAGVQLGQEFYVRRDTPLAPSTLGRGPKTLGWVRIVAVNDTTAIAAVEELCNGILVTDYLDPFVAPAVPADAGRTETPGEPDFSSFAHVVAGTEDRTTLGPGDLATIDWGAERGLMAGTRFAIYRDAGKAGLPLISVGEGIVVSTGHDVALTRITRSRDAIFAGDYIAIRR